MPLLRYIERSHRISILALGIALALPLPALGQAPESLELEADSMPLPSGDVLPGASMGAAGGQEHSPLPESYVLGPGDRIRVDIFNVPEFSGPDNGVHEVLIDGTLSLPMVGILEVRGLTLKQTRQLLAAEYSRLLTRPPYLTVTLLSSRPVRIAVSGEVNRPGTYTTPVEVQADGGGGEPARQWPTLTSVIQEAGGITQQADVRFVEIRRPRRNAPDAVMTADLWELISTGDMEQDVRLRDGDVVYIPTATDISPGDSIAIADANFSPGEIPVQVVGEVKRPGTVQIPANTTLNQAILAAGGFSDSRAKTSMVELVRLNSDGTVDRRSLEVDLSVAANEETNPILRPNDVVMVDRNAVARTGDTLSLILNPITAVGAILRIFGFGF